MLARHTNKDELTRIPFPAYNIASVSRYTQPREDSLPRPNNGHPLPPWRLRQKQLGMATFDQDLQAGEPESSFDAADQTVIPVDSGRLSMHVEREGRKLTVIYIVREKLCSFERRDCGDRKSGIRRLRKPVVGHLWTRGQVPIRPEG